eukprot:gene25524-biopygen1458
MRCFSTARSSGLLKPAGKCSALRKKQRATFRLWNNVGGITIVIHKSTCGVAVPAPVGARHPPPPTLPGGDAECRRARLSGHEPFFLCLSRKRRYCILLKTSCFVLKHTKRLACPAEQRHPSERGRWKGGCNPATLHSWLGHGPPDTQHFIRYALVVPWPSAFFKTGQYFCEGLGIVGGGWPLVPGAFGNRASLFTPQTPRSIISSSANSFRRIGTAF